MILCFIIWSPFDFFGYTLCKLCTHSHAWATRGETGRKSGMFGMLFARYSLLLLLRTKVCSKVEYASIRTPLINGAMPEDAEAEVLSLPKPSTFLLRTTITTSSYFVFCFFLPFDAAFMSSDSNVSTY